MRVVELKPSMDLTMTSVNEALSRYMGQFGAKPTTLLHPANEPTATAIMYSTDALSLHIRMHIQYVVPVPGVDSFWWAIAGQEGMIWSGGA